MHAERVAAAAEGQVSDNDPLIERIRTAADAANVTIAEAEERLYGVCVSVAQSIPAAASFLGRSIEVCWGVHNGDWSIHVVGDDRSIDETSAVTRILVARHVHELEKAVVEKAEELLA